MNPKFILASGSPRRRELLSMLGMEFTVSVSDCDENVEGVNTPGELVKELAARKALAVASQVENREEFKNGGDYIVIGADTVVAFENKILGKPKSEEDAKSTLALLSGKTHSVFTGIALAARIDGKKRAISETVETKVNFGDITCEEIDFYIQSGEPMDKAGSYGIQGIGGFFVGGIEGDYYNVVGLPIFKMKEMLLSEFGLEPYRYLGGGKR